MSFGRLGEGWRRKGRELEECVISHASIRPVPEIRKRIIARKTTADKQVQAHPNTILSEMNTMRAEFADASIWHIEGGWPKDVNNVDPEAVLRYRKKLEKDEAFQAAVPLLTETMEDLIKNNNTINFYRKGYNPTKGLGGDKDLVPSATVVNVYRRPEEEDGPRRASQITFASEGGRMLVAHAPFEFDPLLRSQSGEAWLWDVEVSATPLSPLYAWTHIMNVHFNPKDPVIVIGALFTGHVATWDTRVGPSPTGISAFEVSHRDVATAAQWVNSKTGTEFFSCGLDGQVVWWDTRNLAETVDVVWCDPEKGSCRPEAAIGATVLEYESTLPTKFLCGTERGDVMVFVRKGKSANERMTQLYKAHRGPVKACHRNPVFIKSFLTVGDYQLRIFAEDCKESSIIWTVPSERMYTDAVWLGGRPSGIAACRSDGVVEWWDLLIHGATSILSLQVTDESLTAVATAEGGKHIAVGTIGGDVKLIRMTDFMGEFEKNDKPALAAVFDRESRREKYLEQRGRELRLRKRDADKREAEAKRVAEEEAAEREATGQQDTSGLDPAEARAVRIRHEVLNNPLILAEREFFASITAEMAAKGFEAFAGKSKPPPAPEEGGGVDSDASR